MRLKKLEIYGFKSFAERVEIDFEDGITGIVGPNGSGKSNISDAMRWVLGEQSAKSLRGGKMEDVIFNGTEKRRKLAWCEVILTFDNADHALPVDFSEVAVARRVYRNGDSEYLINRTPCRLRDIVDLFRDTGIGKDGYSMIGQGRIDEILSVKSEDRRQVFEEAAGIMKYKTRKSEAERRMENTRLNLSRVDDMISELESRLEPLKEQSQSAREYLQLRDEIKGLELNAFLVRSERNSARLQELTETLGGLDESVGEAETRREALTGQRETRQIELEQMEDEAARTREQVQSLIREVEAREGAVNLLKERIASTQRECQRLESELAGAEQGEDVLKRRITELSGRIAQETAEVEAEREQLAQMESEIEALTRALTEKEQAAEALKARIIDEMNRASDVRSEQARLTAMKSALNERIAALDGEREGDKTEENIWSERLKAAEDELARERAEKQRLDAELSAMIAQVDMAAATVERLTAQKAKLTNARQETASRLRVLEEMQRDYEGYYHSVKHVLMQARRQPGSGVHGVVATLISVPKELERAIDMVLGGALQNVVVDREEDAKSMIDYLRNNRLGRATFLPISSVRGRTLSPQERNVLKMPGCVGLASELILFDRQYQGIVDSLLGRTVIAESLDAGIAIQRAGRHAFRLVTLGGDVMHSGGSMTGGSAQSNVTSLLSREREVAEHREKLQALIARQEALTGQLAAEEDHRIALKQSRGALHNAVHQQEIACTRAEAHLKSATDGLSAQRDRGGKTHSEALRMASQLEEVASSLESLSARQGDVEQSTAGSQKEVAALQKVIAAERDALSARRAALTDKRVAQAARERGLVALTADYNRMTGEQMDIGRLTIENRTALVDSAARLREDGAQLGEDELALADGRAQLNRARAAFADADGKRAAAQRDLQAIATQLDKLRVQHEDLTDRRHRCELQRSRVEAELQQMTDRIWEDYELSYAGAEEFRVEEFKLAEAERRIAAIRARIRELGSVNVGAVDEYRQVQQRFDEMSVQRDDLYKAQIDLMRIIDELVAKMEVQFREQFHALNRNFQETFVALFGGGRAELQLTDPKDVLGCGIEIVAQPPGKKLQMLSLLSGGERALTAIAILFAMLKLKPTPFCFLDEIEAALDDANIANFADYLQDYSRSTQFVVVTHRKGTMERCDALYGVAMEEKGVSKMVSIKLRDAAAG